MPPDSHRHAAVAPTEVLDPVCGMTISPDDAVGHIDHRGQTYYFCSQSCLERFKLDPEHFLNPNPISVPALRGDMAREYTWPIRGIVRARRLSRNTMGNIRQNLFFAFIYNVAGVPITAGILYPWSGLLLSPMIASAAMTFSSVSVIVNALRLKRARL